MALEKGDLIWVNIVNAQGHEMKDRHPGVVISPTRYNQITGMATFCSITHTARGNLLEVPIPQGLAIEGIVNISQIHTIDTSERKPQVVGKLNQETMNEICKKLVAFFG